MALSSSPYFPSAANLPFRQFYPLSVSLYHAILYRVRNLLYSLNIHRDVYIQRKVLWIQRVGWKWRRPASRLDAILLIPFRLAAAVRLQLDRSAAVAAALADPAGQVFEYVCISLFEIPCMHRRCMVAYSCPLLGTVFVIIEARYCPCLCVCLCCARRDEIRPRRIA